MKSNKSLLLRDFLEVENIENCKPCELELAYENIIDRDSKSDISYHLDNLCYDAFKRLPIDKKERHVLRFIKFPPQKDKNGQEKGWDGSQCPIISDINNCTITLSSPNGFNDPMDPLIKNWLVNKNKEQKNDKKIYQFIIEALDKIRICCLVDPNINNNIFNNIFRKKNGYDNPLMWSHYADSHRGICIQYKITQSNLADNKDEIVRLLDIDYYKSFPLDGNISFIDSLIVKSNYWKYEKETRLIIYPRNVVDKYYQLSNFEVESVYMGVRIDNKKRDFLKDMLKNNSIKLYQMTFSKNDISKLEAKEIQKK
ncbi:MAG: DUF2971 domain-containing protein [Bacteroidales bacterium]|nr:DUF2971 domain-containing protein [Bacteroidales bacterium]